MVMPLPRACVHFPSQKATVLGFLSALKLVRSSLPQLSLLLILRGFAKPHYLARKKASGFQMDWTPLAFPVRNSVVGEKKRFPGKIYQRPLQRLLQLIQHTLQCYSHRAWPC